MARIKVLKCQIIGENSIFSCYCRERCAESPPRAAFALETADQDKEVADWRKKKSLVDAETAKILESTVAIFNFDSSANFNCLLMNFFRE